MRIGSWLRERKAGGGIEYFNAASRLIVYIDPNQYPDGREYWSVFIMRRRKVAPSKGKAPTYRKTFATKELAMKFATSFMKRNPMNLNYLLAMNRANTRAIIAHFRKLLYTFFTGTAFMAPHGKDAFIREGLVIVARPVVRDVLNSIYIEMKSGKFSQDVFITFTSLNNTVDSFRENEAYYLNKINKAALHVWGMNEGYRIVGKVLTEIKDKQNPKPPVKQVYLLGPQKPDYQRVPQLPIKENQHERT